MTDGARNRESLLLASGKLGWLAVGLIVNCQQLQNFRQIGVDLFISLAALYRSGNPYVGSRSKGWQKVELLEYKTKLCAANRGSLRIVHTGNVLALHQYLPACCTRHGAQ